MVWPEASTPETRAAQVARLAPLRTLGIRSASAFPFSRFAAVISLSRQAWNSAWKVAGKVGRSVLLMVSMPLRCAAEPPSSFSQFERLFSARPEPVVVLAKLSGRLTLALMPSSPTQKA